MGRHVHEGVVDSWGESFGHPGLFVVDGSPMPGPVGPNPSLTIAAIADRAVERLLEKPARIAVQPSGIASTRRKRHRGAPRRSWHGVHRDR